MYKTIRKNSIKKISAYLKSSVGIIGKTSSNQVDDSYDATRRLITDPSEVLKWLSSPENYNDARVYLDEENGTFHVRGQYHFNDAFEVYFDKAKFLEDAKYFGLFKASEKAKVCSKIEPTGNVVSLCAYRQRQSA